MHRLMIWHALLRNLVERARATDQHCTWLMLADAAAQRLELDLEELREWLDALDTSPGTDPVAPAPS